MSAGTFHLTRNGDAALCEAAQRACPLGAEAHFASFEEAMDFSLRRAIEADMAAFESYGMLTDEAMDEMAALVEHERDV